jgi:crotonobetainyl-CoA:carnitine CoA-transferase CaiB-like acyl-CoA transferase
MMFSRTRVEHGRPPPLLGEHTEAVLRDVLGSSDAEIARWRDQGAI